MQSFMNRLILGSVIIFLSCCSLFKGKNQEAAGSQESLAAAEQMMKENKFVEALETLDKMDYPGLSERQKYLYAFLKLKAAHEAERYEYFRWRGAAILIGTEYNQGINEVIEEMRKSENPLARWHAFNFLIRTKESLKEQKGIVIEVLKDPNPVLRYYALTWIDMRQDFKGLEDLAIELERCSRDDPDPMNRAFAGQALRRKRSGVRPEDMPSQK
jgi:hypothetical protein